MVLNATDIFKRTLAGYYDPSKRRVFNEGGTYSSKTFSILQVLYLLAVHSSTNLLISVVSESVPHLKRGCIRDFKNVLGDAYNPNRYNETDRIYEVKPGVFIEFFPADDADKLRGARRDILYINECNNVTKAAFDELDVRTERFTFTDNNPTEPFWMHELRDYPENLYVHSTYNDAKKYLADTIIKNIESRREKDPNWWRVYGEGLVGKAIGIVHPHFSVVKQWPTNIPVDSHGYGLDFGFSNNPTALVENILSGEHLYSRLICYQTGMTNADIIKKMQDHGIRERYDVIWADCAEPKSIEEIYQANFDVKPVSKGQDSVEAGIQKVNQFYQHWCEEDVDAIKEQRNYRYFEDKNGKITNKPVDFMNHAMDARRYWLWMEAAELIRHQARTLRVAI